MIQRGIDIFTTPADGRTFYDFAQNPIPAGFFCKGSKAFTGRVAFKGLPLATGTPGQLRGADTVIERLDDAVFDAKGTAVTRIQFRALSLVSIAPIKTACGAFHVYVSLGGKQRVTTMSIHRTQEGGGNFVAPLAVDARLTFIPVKPREEQGRAEAGAHGRASPSLPGPFRGASRRARGEEDRPRGRRHQWRPDPGHRLPGTSNFSPGRSPESRAQKNDDDCSHIQCWTPVCHDAGGKNHCSEPPEPEPPCLIPIC